MTFNDRYFLANTLGFVTGLNSAYNGDILNPGNGILVGTSVIVNNDFYNQMSHTHFLTNFFISPIAHFTYLLKGSESLPDAAFYLVTNNLLPYATDYLHNVIHHSEVHSIGHIHYYEDSSDI